MNIEVIIADRTSFVITVPGTNFTKFAEDVVKLGGLQVIQDGFTVWYPVSAIRSLRLL